MAKLWRWVASFVARPLDTAALGVRIQTSYQKYIMSDISKGVADKHGTFEKMFKTRINKKKTQ